VHDMLILLDLVIRGMSHDDATKISLNDRMGALATESGLLLGGRFAAGTSCCHARLYESPLHVPGLTYTAPRRSPRRVSFPARAYSSAVAIWGARPAEA
jgi:hypothetical protein